MATFLGSALIGGWYIMHKTMPPKIPEQQKRNKTTTLYNRVQPKSRISQAMATHLTVTDRQERVLNIASPAFRDKATRDNLLKSKDDLWLEHQLNNDRYDNLINERDPNPRYNGNVIRLEKRRYVHRANPINRVEDRLQS